MVSILNRPASWKLPDDISKCTLLSDFCYLFLNKRLTVCTCPCFKASWIVSRKTKLFWHKNKIILILLLSLLHGSDQWLIASLLACNCLLLNLKPTLNIEQWTTIVVLILMMQERFESTYGRGKRDTFFIMVSTSNLV